MILYKKGGKDFILMANTSRGVMKVPTDTFAAATPLTMPSNQETAGVPFEKIPSMAGRAATRPSGRDALDRSPGRTGSAAEPQSVELP